MRLTLLLTLLIAGVSIYPPTNEYLKKLPDESMALLREIAFTKEVRVSGAKFVSEREVKASLPLQQSVFWWLTNPNEVVGGIKANNYVSDATLKPCSRWILPSWGCFEIQIRERIPTYIAFIDNESWLVGSGGEFMFPLDEGDGAGEMVQRVEGEYGPLKVVKGLSRTNASPDVVKARFQYTVKALKTVERITDLKVGSAELKKNGELSVSLRSPPISARFDFAKDDWGVLEEEASRLKTLLREFEGRESTIQEIDLAYQRLAVVKMVPEPTQQKEDSNG